MNRVSSSRRRRRCFGIAPGEVPASHIYSSRMRRKAVMKLIRLGGSWASSAMRSISSRTKLYARPTPQSSWATPSRVWPADGLLALQHFCLHFVIAKLHFPALVVERNNLARRKCFAVYQGSEQPLRTKTFALVADGSSYKPLRQ